MHMLNNIIYWIVTEKLFKQTYLLRLLENSAHLHMHGVILSPLIN